MKNSCKYCYANKNPKRVKDNYLLHDLDSPLLFGHLGEDDEVKQGSQQSFLKKSRNVMSLDQF